MASKTFTFVHRVNGLLMDVDTIDGVYQVRLSDPTSSFGLRHQATGTVVVANDTPMVRTDLATYQYTVEGLTPSETYEAWFEWTYQGVVQRREYVFVAGAYNVLGRYGGDIQARFGEDNARIWSNIGDDSASIDWERIEEAYDYSYGRINDFFHGVILTPFTNLTGGSEQVVKEWDSVIAGLWLQSSRPRARNDDNYDGLMADIWYEMSLYKVGLRRLKTVDYGGPGIVAGV